MDKAAKRYLVRFGSAMLAYVIILPLAVIFAQQNSHSPWRFVLMLIPVIPVSLALLAFVEYFDTLDELQKRIQLYALALSAGATSIVAMTIGMLETAGMPHLSWVWIFPIIAAFWGLGAVIATRRYK